MFHAIRLSKTDPTPLYIQLASELASLIQKDIFYDGFKLPAIRYLSKQLSINRDTVVSAYKLLEQQGLVESYIGKGTYISHAPSKTSPASFQSDTKLCCSQLKFHSDFFPKTLCQSLISEMITTEGWEIFSDPLLRNRNLLKQNICSFFKALGIDAHFAQIRFTSSFNEFIMSLYKFFPKTGICVENLRDLSLSCHLHSLGAKVHEIPLTREGMDLDILEKQLRSGTVSYIIVSPYLQNPTGLNYSHENKQSLLELAQKYDCYIIEDGTYCDHLSPDIHYVPLFNMCQAGRVIYMYHFSRLYLPQLRYTFFVLPGSLSGHINDDSLNSFNEHFLQYYLASDAFSDLRAVIRHITHSHYKQLASILSQKGSPLSPSCMNGGSFFWLKSHVKCFSDLLGYLASKQLIIAPGELFTSHPLPGFLRLSIGELTDSDLDEAIKVIMSYQE